MRRFTEGLSETGTRVLGIVRGWRRRHKHDWVSDRVKQQMHEHQQAQYAGRGVCHRLRDRVRSLGFWLLAIVAVLLVIGASIGLHSAFPDIVDDSWYGLLTTLWQVEASLAGITFVIAALLLESRAREARSDDIFSYYIRTCRLVPLVIATFAHILLFAIFAYLRFGTGMTGAWLDVAIWAVSLGFIAFVVANVLLWLKVLRLLGPLSLAQARREIILGTISQTLPDIAESISYDRYAKSHLYGAQVEYHGWDFEERWKPIRATSSGLVTDIDLARANDISRRLDGEELPSSTGVHLVREIGDLVTEGDVIVRVDPALSNSRLSPLLRKVYRIRKATAAPSAELVRSFANLREDILDHIYARRERDAKISLDTFRMSVTRVLDLWSIHGLEDDLTAVRTQYLDEGPLSASLYEIKSIAESVLTQAAEFGSERMLAGTVVDVCAMLMECSIRGQRGLFRLLCFAVSSSYSAIAEKRVLGVRQTLLTELICEHVGHLARGISGGPSSHGHRPRRTTDSFDCMLELVALYSDLLKAATDHQDESGFNYFHNGLSELGQRHRSSTNTTDQPVHDMASTNLTVWTDMVSFGIGAWILRRLMDGTQDSELGSMLLDRTCDYLGSHERLAGLYEWFLRENRYLAEFLCWYDWSLPVVPRTWSYFPDLVEMIHVFYCVESLRLLSHYEYRRVAIAYDLSPDPVSLDVKVDLTHLDRVPLRKAARRIRWAAGSLKAVVDEQALEHLDAFVALHGRPGPDYDEVHVVRV